MRTYDPQYPRHRTRAQADRSFYTALEFLTINSIEAILNAKETVYECPACGTLTYGDPVECGKCGKRRGVK